MRGRTQRRETPEWICHLAPGTREGQAQLQKVKDKLTRQVTVSYRKVELVLKVLTGQVTRVLATGAGGSGTGHSAGTLREAVGVADVVRHGGLLHLLVGEQSVGWGVGGELTVARHQHWRKN